jgi:Lysylphosphatidylglycerol synthase TM region
LANRRWLWRVLQLVILAFVAWGMYRVIAPELASIRAADFRKYRPSWPLIALSTVVLLAMYLLHFLLWRTIVNTLSAVPIRVGPAFRVYFVSSLGRYIPGKLWQVAGMAALAQRAGISPVAATAAALLGQLAFMSMGLVFLAALLPSLYGRAAILGAVLLLSLAIALFVLGDTDRGKAVRHRVLLKLGPRIAAAGQLLDQLSARRAAVWWVAYGFTWVLLGGAFALFVIAFTPQQAGEYRLFAGTVAASYLWGLLLFLPAGLGVREGVMILLLTPVITAPGAVIVSAASRLWFTVAELLPLSALPLLPQRGGPA